MTDGTREVLSDHAERVGRTFPQECRLWLDLGMAAITYAALNEPGKEEELGIEEVERQREVALRFMAHVLARALPHPIAPEAILRALIPAASAN